MQVLDLRPPAITVKFSKGSTLNPIFFYLGAGNSVIDMTGFTAHAQARLSPLSEDVLPGWDLTTGNGGLTIVTANAETPDGIVVGAQGVQLNVPKEVTSTLTCKTAVFGVEITSPSGITTTLVTGILEPVVEIVR